MISIFATYSIDIQHLHNPLAELKNIKFWQNTLIIKKFLFEALSVRFSNDQAANPCGVLAWSYAQSRVFDPPSVFDANA